MKLKGNRSVLLLSVILLVSCRFVSLEKIQVTHFPSERNVIISRNDTLWIDFSIPLDNREAEGLFGVYGDTGSGSGIFTWDENRLIFDPVPDLAAGGRYVFTYQGTAESADGRTFSFDIQVPFFVETDSPPPVILQHDPADAATASTQSPLILTFSRAMDTESFEEGFRITPSLEFDSSWNAAEDTVTIMPQEEWRNLTLYTWRLTEEIRDKAGIALAYPFSSCFIVQEDSESPTLTEIQPAERSGANFIPIAVSDPNEPLKDLKVRDAIMMSFSEDILFDSLSSAFKMDPSVSGYIQRIDVGIFVFVPLEGYTMNQTYHLSIRTDVKDLSGNPMQAEYELWFEPDIDIQQVDKIVCQGATVQEYFPGDFNQSEPVFFDLEELGADRIHTFTIRFTTAYDDEESRTRVAGNIQCEAFFPPSLPHPDLESIGWNVQGTEITLTYTNFEFSPAGIQENLYLVTIPGGKEESINQHGAFLEEDVRLLLEATES